MKPVFTLLNTGLVLLIAGLCAEILYQNIFPKYPAMTNSKGFHAISGKGRDDPEAEKSDKREYKLIVTRNLFKVAAEKPDKDSSGPVTGREDSKKLEPTSLELVLWGTVTGKANPWAVIEDKKTRKQNLYQIGDSVQNAEIKKIFRHEVVLNYEGKAQVLVMKTESQNHRMGQESSQEAPEMSKSVQTKGQVNMPENVKKMMQQIRFRPHFTQGQPDGLMVYGIRPNSVFRRIGLRNGDIVKEINGSKVISGSDASELFAEIDNSGVIRIALLRRGKRKELLYRN